MKLTLILITLLLTYNNALAECKDRDFSHIPACEKFTILDDTSQVAHFFAGISMSVVGTLILKKAGVKPVPAILASVALSALIGTGKEIFVDQYTSKNGIKSFWAGASVGGLTVTILEF